MAANNMKQSEVMKVDVGGSTFHVSRSVLVAEPDSLLDSLFSGRFHIDTQADGSVFIDRLRPTSAYDGLFCCMVTRNGHEYHISFPGILNTFPAS